MKCSVVEVGGIRAIVCGSRRYKVQKCKTCGKPATKLCDWIREWIRPPAIAIAVSTLTTCDEAICDACTTSPAPGKDLCPTHSIAWKQHPANTQRSLELEPARSAPASDSSSTSSAQG